MSHLVETRDLGKTYVRGRQKVEVLHHVNLDIERGDFLALMGPSGSGKTTLLNLIGGLDSPSGGSIRVDGQRIDTMSGTQLAKWRAVAQRTAYKTFADSVPGGKALIDKALNVQ